MFTTLFTTRLNFLAPIGHSRLLESLPNLPPHPLQASASFLARAEIQGAALASASPRDSTEVLPVPSSTRARRWGSVRSWAGNSNRSALVRGSCGFAVPGAPHSRPDRSQGLASCAVRLGTVLRSRQPCQLVCVRFSTLFAVVTLRRDL